MVSANAFGQDTEITIRIAPASDYPDLMNPRSNVLVMEPEGLFLQTPANVSLDAPLGGETYSALQRLSGNRGAGRQPLTSGVAFTSTGMTAIVSTLAPLAIVAEPVVDGGGGHRRQHDDAGSRVVRVRLREDPSPGVTLDSVVARLRRWGDSRRDLSTKA